ncbi:MAG: hypothetical protein HZA03_12330 [Nitrospinae bacterium]|nr:hypothetical protein [Nitrospinota bacterium]
MKPPVLLFTVLVLAAADGAHAEKKQVSISGARTETHISGANTPQSGKDDKIHASGATTTPAPSKAASAKKGGQNVPQNQPVVTHQFNDERPAPGEVRKPRQPEQATVEKPRPPGQPRTPELPRSK